MKRHIGAAFVALALILTACRKPPVAKPAPPPKVVVVAARQQDEPIYREWIGTTEGDVNAEIRPKIDGYLLRRDYTEGSLVREGQLLFEIDPRQFNSQMAQAEANLEQANAGLAKAQHDVARFEPLAAQKAISQQELDNARSAERAALATVDALKAALEQARLNRAWTRVTSPISGIAGIAQQQVGDLVNPQAVLTTVSKVDPIRVRYQMSEQEYLQYQKDPQMHNAQLQLILSDGSVFPHPGRLLLSGTRDRREDGDDRHDRSLPQSRQRPPSRPVREDPCDHGGPPAAPSSCRSARSTSCRAPTRSAWSGRTTKSTSAPSRSASASAASGSSSEGLQPGDRVITEGFSRVKPGHDRRSDRGPPPRRPRRSAR